MTCCTHCSKCCQSATHNCLQLARRESRSKKMQKKGDKFNQPSWLRRAAGVSLLHQNSYATESANGDLESNWKHPAPEPGFEEYQCLNSTPSGNKFVGIHNRMGMKFASKDSQHFGPIGPGNTKLQPTPCGLSARYGGVHGAIKSQAMY
eukprot:1140096-Pelagomonas_calceolata.AAC.3